MSWGQIVAFPVAHRWTAGQSPRVSQGVRKRDFLTDMSTTASGKKTRKLVSTIETAKGNQIGKAEDAKKEQAQAWRS